MVRTQLYLDEAMHARLRDLAQKQGRTISELVREALSRVYAPADGDERLSTLQAVEGLWQDRDDIGDTHEYVRRLRRDTRSRRKRES
ncbi:MAG: CopG family transcriptional regulator [Myxococcota bacterium]